MKIISLLESEQSSFYRGVDDAPMLRTIFSSQERDSIYDDSNLLRDIWDKVAVPNIPLLHDTALRSNCLIMSRNKKHAAEFGDVCTLEVQTAETPFTWAREDYNMFPLVRDKMEAMITAMMEYTDDGHLERPTFQKVVAELQHRVEADAEQAEAWKQYSNTDFTPIEYIVDMFQQLINKNQIGVCRRPEEVPTWAKEVWFRGTAMVTDFEENE